jgi:hypothetical protein
MDADKTRAKDKSKGRWRADPRDGRSLGPAFAPGVFFALVLRPPPARRLSVSRLFCPRPSCPGHRRECYLPLFSTPLPKR